MLKKDERNLFYSFEQCYLSTEEEEEKFTSVSPIVVVGHQLISFLSPPTHHAACYSTADKLSGAETIH